MFPEVVGVCFLKRKENDMTRFRVKYYEDADCGDGCCYIIQKKKLFFWRWYDYMFYTKKGALARLEYIKTNYPNVKPITDVIKEIKL